MDTAAAPNVTSMQVRIHGPNSLRASSGTHTCTQTDVLIDMKQTARTGKHGTPVPPCDGKHDPAQGTDQIAPCK